MTDDDQATLEDLWQWAQHSPPPSEIEPVHYGQQIVVGDHEIEAVDPTFTNDDLVWECQHCGEKGVHLGLFGVICDG